jgi:peptide/nickel transport system permease protein
MPSWGLMNRLLLECPWRATAARQADDYYPALHFDLKDHVRAAKALGASNAGVIRRHILPNILSPLIVVATTQIAGAIIAEAALSFLGLGLPITQPSLGTSIRSGYDLIFAGIWWVTVLPGLTLVGVLVAVNVLGDTLRDALDPRLTPS